jgi:hypothetical protein
VSSFSSAFTHYLWYIPTTPTPSVKSTVEHAVGIGRLPDHFLASVLEIWSRSAHRDGELGAIVGEREGCRC